MAKNFMSSILDELMGRDRDALPDEAPRKMNWDDPEMCPFYLVCFCPHELFVNTKADLGSCSKFHDEQLKKKYAEEAPGYKKSLNEAEFIRFAEKMIADIEGKIKRGKMRIALANGPDGGTYAGPGSKNAEKIALLTDRINTLLNEAEAAGCEGDVEKAQGLMKLCDQLKDEKEQLKSNEVSHPWNPDKAMQVCEVCGSYLIIGEAQHRLDDHIMGKQHVGFAMLRKNLDDVKKAKEKRDQEEREKMERDREKRWASRNAEREKERVSGSSRDRRRDSETSDKRSRGDRGGRHRDRDRKEKDSELDRDRSKHSQSRDKERERSRDKDRSSKDKDRSRDVEKESREGKHRRDHDKGRSRDHKRKSSSRDRDSKHRRSSDDSRKSRDRRSRSRSKRSRSRDRKDREGRRSHKRSHSDKEREHDNSQELNEKDSEKSNTHERSVEKSHENDDAEPTSSKVAKLFDQHDMQHDPQENSERMNETPNESSLSPPQQERNFGPAQGNGLRELGGIPSDPSLRLEDVLTREVTDQ